MSIAVPLHGFGSGGSSLNFKILPYVLREDIQASAPADNTIGVVTYGEEITAWVFAPVRPGSMAEGMLWVATGNASPAAFNALKKNAITINPVACWQYIGGQLVQREAYLRLNGEWVELWDGTLFDFGDSHEKITGGFVNTATNAGGAVITANSDGSLTIKPGANYGASIYHTKNKIDLSGFETLHMYGEIWEADGPYRCGLGIWTEIGTDAATNRAAFVMSTMAAGDAEYIIDVSSLTGSYYIGVWVQDHPNYASVTMDELWLT